MKKNILIYMFVLLCCFIGINTVSANTSCVYGTRKGNDGSTWAPQFKLNIVDWNQFYIDVPGSPLLKETGISSVKSCSSSDNCTFEGEWVQDWSIDGDIYFYISMYATEDTYKLNNGKCPKALIYEYKKEGGDMDVHHLLFYNDDLDRGEVKDFKYLYNHSKYDLKSYLILEGEKDSPLEELVDPYNCSTYYNYKQAIVNSVEKSESKSCDNNKDFNNYYQKLRGLCDNYRSTSIYVETDEDDNIVATACNKACSMLKDDVADICSAYPEGGYCGSFGNELVNWFIRVLNIFRYAIPALLIILSILDYIKAIAADSEDEMKKVNKRFINRLIAGAAIFLVPFIINFLLGMFDIPGLNADNPFCAK